MIDSQLVSQFQPYLGAGERVVWTGRPPAGLRFAASDLFLVPFSLMWGGFAIFWEATVVNSSGGLFFTLWGVPFVLIGLYLIVGRFFADAWVRGRMIYALTNQRALTLRRISGEKLITARLGAAVLERGRDGRGTLRFGPGAGGWATTPLFGMRRGMGWNTWMPSLSDQVEFLAVDDVMAAYKLASLEPASG